MLKCSANIKRSNRCRFSNISLPPSTNYHKIERLIYTKNKQSNSCQYNSLNSTWHRWFVCTAHTTYSRKSCMQYRLSSKYPLIIWHWSQFYLFKITSALLFTFTKLNSPLNTNEIQVHTFYIPILQCVCSFCWLFVYDFRLKLNNFL